MAEQDPRAPKGRRLDIKMNPEMHRGVYANKSLVAHSRDEFVLDFVSDLPPGPEIVARIVTSPAHARALLDALGENVARYERQHGPIRRNPKGKLPAADA